MDEQEKHELLREIETLRGEKTALEQEKRDMIFDRRLETALAKENVRQVHMVKALLDTERLEVDENDEFVNLHQQLEDIMKEAPSLFHQKQDGVYTGSTGNFSRNKSAAGAENPWARESFNLTKQGEIYRKDPMKARKLMQLAK